MTGSTTVRRDICENGLNPDYHLCGRVVGRNGKEVRFQYSSYHFNGSFRANPFYEKIFADGRVQTSEAVTDRQLNDELRRHLRGRLPEYMTPSAIVTLDALPTTRNGKIDRRALRAMGTLQRDRNGPMVPPRTPVENAIAQIWIDLLGVPEVGYSTTFSPVSHCWPRG